MASLDGKIVSILLPVTERNKVKRDLHKIKRSDRARLTVLPIEDSFLVYLRGLSVHPHPSLRTSERLETLSLGTIPVWLVKVNQKT